MEQELDNIVEDIHKYKLENLDSTIIKKVKYDVLKSIIEERKELTHFYKLLLDYIYMDEVDEFRLGSYIRFFNLNKANDVSLELLRGGFICDLKTTKDKNDILIVCKNGIRFFNIKMNECIIFQKNTKQEKILIEIIDHLKDKNN
jgi:hypothetical protein